VQFPPPTLEAVVAPLHKQDGARMRNALAELSEQDPLINVRQDDETEEISVSLYGDVQREVIEATLARDYGVTASFRATSVVYIERPIAAAEAEQVIAAATHSNISGRSSPFSENPYAATLGLRIEPLAPGAGIDVVVDLDVHLIPMYVYNNVPGFSAAMSEYVRDVLRSGLYGWEVTDCRVTVWDSGYFRTGSTARDFRLLTGLVLRDALKKAGTVVCEPMTVMRIELPAAATGGVGSLLGQSGARVTGQFTSGDLATMSAVIATANVGEIKRRLSGASFGEGVMETEFGGYMPVSGPPPVRRGSRRAQ
jgi:ribosomal protection tetracycline resistance protein